MDSADKYIQGRIELGWRHHIDLGGPGKAVNLLAGRKHGCSQSRQTQYQLRPILPLDVEANRAVLEILFEVLIKELWFEEAIVFGRISAHGFFQIQDSDKPGHA